MHDIINLVVDEIRGAWRFRRWALVSAWAICMLGWLYVLMLPNQYEATSRVFVDPSTALKPVIQGLAIEQDVNAELSFVRQSLLSEPQLRKVIEQTGLGNRAVTPAEKADAVKALQARIEIAVQGAPAGDDQSRNPSRVYAIRYLDTTRERSLQVVEILLNNFMEQTLGGKREGSENAQKFLEVQIKDYERRLRAAEDRLAEFKKRNIGLMPTEQGGYFSQLQMEIDAAKKTETVLSIALSKRAELARQMRGEAVITAAGSTPFVGASGVTSGTDTLSRIKETQARIDDLLLRFTEQHPDVIAARQTLEELQRRRKAEIESLKRGDANAVAASGAGSNPVYQSIQLALNQADVEIASLRGELNQHRSKAVELRKRLDSAPQVEAEYAQLNRDYDVNKTQYTALLANYEKARMGERADSAGSIRFEVIDPPAVGFKPASPNRLLLLAGVLVAGLGGGIGIAYLLNKLKPVFNDVRSLAEATGLTVLGAISLSRTDADKGQLQRSYIRYSAAAAALMIMFFIAVLVGRYLSPLGAVLHGS